MACMILSDALTDYFCYEKWGLLGLRAQQFGGFITGFLVYWTI